MYDDEESLSKRARECVKLSNQIIEALIDADHDEAIEVIAVVASAYSAVKAGYYATGLEAGLTEEYLNKMILRFDESEQQNFQEVRDIATAMMTSGSGSVH